MEETKSKIWSRLFSLKNDEELWWFDVIIGVIWPIIALIIDPGIFQPGVFGLLAVIREFFFTGIIVSVISLAIWLFLNKHIRWLDGLISGILLTAGIVAFIVQLIMLPFLLIAVFAIITIFTNFLVGLLAILTTILGILPLLTGFVYLRNGLIAKQQAKIRLSHRNYIASIAIGTILLLSASSLVQWRVNSICSQQIRVILEKDSHFKPDSTDISAAIQQLRESSKSCELPLEKMVWAYSDETDNIRKQFLADTYFEITHKDIEDRLLTLLED